MINNTIANIVPFLAVLLTAYVSIKIKFAESEKALKNDFKKVILILLKLLSGCLYLFCLFNLILLFQSPEPLDKLTLSNILSSSFALFSGGLFIIISNIQGAMSKLASLQKKQLDLISNVLDSPKSGKG